MNKTAVFLFCFFFAYVQFSIAEEEARSMSSEKDDFYVDILAKTEDEVFADFSDVVDEDIDKIFDELESVEDVEEPEETTELFKDEVSKDVLGKSVIDEGKEFNLE